jgi:hypothetical protein
LEAVDALRYNISTLWAGVAARGYMIIFGIGIIARGAE